MGANPSYRLLHRTGELQRRITALERLISPARCAQEIAGCSGVAANSACATRETSCWWRPPFPILGRNRRCLGS